MKSVSTSLPADLATRSWSAEGRIGNTKAMLAGVNKKFKK